MTDSTEYSKPNPPFLTIIWKVISAFVQMIIKSREETRVKKQSRLTEWRNKYIEKRNARIQRASMRKSVDDLLRSQDKNSSGKARSNPSDK